MNSKSVSEAATPRDDHALNGAGTPFIPKQDSFPKPGAATKGTPRMNWGYPAPSNKAKGDGSGPTGNGRGRAWPKSSK
jgi:hypothetical protein